MDMSRSFDPDNKYSVPYCWGTVGILYNTSMVAPEDAPTKWSDLWDEKFKDNILMQDLSLIHILPQNMCFSSVDKRMELAAVSWDNAFGPVVDMVCIFSIFGWRSPVS